MKNVRREDWENLKPTIYDWGINDVNYNICKRETIRRAGHKSCQKLVWMCPYYADWVKMVDRCFCAKRHKQDPSYAACDVYEGWRYLSNFIEWVDSQPNKDWKNCQLDKDLLITGNKLYSPETCTYIQRRVNLFLVGSNENVNGLMIGVSIDRRSKVKKFTAQCKNHFTGRHEFLGNFKTELEAHLVWKAKKHEHACRLADLQDDSRVAEALRQRYAPDKDLTNLHKKGY